MKQFSYLSHRLSELCFGKCSDVGFDGRRNYNDNEESKPPARADGPEDTCGLRESSELLGPYSHRTLTTALVALVASSDMWTALSNAWKRLNIMSDAGAMLRGSYPDSPNWHEPCQHESPAGWPSRQVVNRRKYEMTVIPSSAGSNRQSNDGR